MDVRAIAVAWCAVYAGGSTGPHLFESIAGQTNTLDEERYRVMLKDCLLSQLDELILRA